MTTFKDPSKDIKRLLKIECDLVRSTDKPVLKLDQLTQSNTCGLKISKLYLLIVLSQGLPSTIKLGEGVYVHKQAIYLIQGLNRSSFMQ